jgi:mRNA-degrading endonuclease RelE of RelBE toxin-antitoxin system
MFDVELAPASLTDLDWFKSKEQKAILASIDEQLSHEPDKETRNRKRLRPGHLTEWEVRIGDVRVFYDIDLDSNLVTERT